MVSTDRAGDNLPLSLPQKPLLPSAGKLRPYLARIDSSRWYSNRGELVWELETRLSRLFGSQSHSMISFSSGTAALEAAILATAGWATDERPIALLPAYTFVATAHAAMRCGYRIHLMDVDSDSWMLSPTSVQNHHLLKRVGLVVAVAAYGRSPDMRAWESLQRETGLPVVVDAAAAFERFTEDPALISRTVPTVLSFHATKAFSTAEGGAVVLNDPVRLRRLGCTSNFGMDETRQCLLPGLNGKLSEYHAAIGLALLDEWNSRSAAYRNIARCYTQACTRLPGRIVTAPMISSSYICYESPDSSIAEHVTDTLLKNEIATRRWYGRGLHRQPFFASCPADPLPVTDDLSARHLGLPAAIDLSGGDIHLVADTLLRALS